MIVLDGTTGITTPTINGTGEHVTSVTGFKNRIINGGMVIDQRNAGAAVTSSVIGGTYIMDRFYQFATQASKLTVQQVAAPSGFTGFTNAAKITVASAATISSGDVFAFDQAIEGYNIADLGWGAAGAKSVTVSFWAQSSISGSYPCILLNAGGNRSYINTYTLAANTPTYVSVTFPGDTSGTWGTTNGVGAYLIFGLGAGSTLQGTPNQWNAANYNGTSDTVQFVATAGATFYITGVQLEKGSVATSFDYRPYGTELSLCQRYYFKNIQTSTILAEAGFAPSTTLFRASTKYPVPMRTAPTALEQTGIATDYRVLGAGASTTTCNSVPTFSAATEHIGQTNFPVAAGLTAYSSGAGSSANTITAYLGWSAEL